MNTEKTFIKIEKKTTKDNITVYTFYWNFDWTNVDNEFDSIYEDLWDFKNKKVIFNLKWLDYINSKAIWYFWNLWLKIKSKWWKVFITNSKEKIIDILMLVWVAWNIIPLLSTEEIAIEEILKNA